MDQAQRSEIGVRNMFGLSATGLWLCLALLLKPFYLLPSGSFQLGDICLVIAFVAYLLKKKSALYIEPCDFLLALFIICVVVINGIYFCIYQTSDFIMQTSYYMFNFITVILFRAEMRSDVFLKRMSQVLRADLIAQLAIYCVGAGRWYLGVVGGSSRYMGTFNDPNQLAFFMFSAYAFIQIVRSKRGIRAILIDDAVTLFIVLQTASTGMLAGTLLIFIPKIVKMAVTFFSNKRFSGFAWLLMLSVCYAMAVFPFAHSEMSKGSSLFVFERIGNKFSKLAGSNEGGTSFQDSILADRQLDKLILYPEKILYGAGQGAYERFERANSANEIHSSFLGMLFYYGIGPFSVLMMWIVSNFKKAKQGFYVSLIYVAFFAETLTLTNQRQPLFWILLVLVALPTLSANDALGVKAKSGNGFKRFQNDGLAGIECKRA